ncbi:interleukin-1 receptor type 1-like isoform X2 [Narcine bancroftii]|uniref:interleukin-1 receptor type 1-like isoform X2 n=1 Tax=Narcine bancroftii TaxID=1343680 RepID=UPI003831417F
MDLLTFSDGCYDLKNEILDIILHQEAFTFQYFKDDIPNPEHNETIEYQCFKNNLEIITTDQEKRIHLNGLSLWFLPALLLDSGNYSCYLWNTTYCMMEVLQIKVFQLPQNQCFHHECLQHTLEESPASVYIYCHGIDDFSQSPLNIQWYKDCNLIDVNRGKYLSDSEKLQIENAGPEDNGMYTCKFKFVYFGRKYHVTKTTELKIKYVKLISPEMINPKNNTIEARLGSELNVTCEVHFGYGNVQFFQVYWQMDETKIPTDEARIKQGPEISKEGTDHSLVVLRTLIISKIIEEDFQIKFDCFANNLRGIRNGFLNILRKSPDWTFYVVKTFIPLIFGFLACVSMYAIFKVDIVLWYRDSFESKKIFSDGKKFDAYVIYPRSENKGSLDNCNANYFALHILPQVLEKKYGYRLFIYGRDEVPGQVVAEVIENNIRNSRRLIIILTQKISDDDQIYSGFEHKIGLFDALILNEIKVILIELEQFDGLNDFPESLRHVIQKNGTIKWKSGEKSKPDAVCSRFWKRVRYKMPPRYKTVAGAE